jgi:hypothetical protein
MKNYYLKFQNQAELESVLVATDLADVQDEQFVPKTNLDVIGLIYKPTGKVLKTEDGFDYPEQAAVEGWHANLKAELSEDQETALSEFLVTEPATPARKWAGE